MTTSHIHNRLQSMTALAVGLGALVLTGPALVAADGDLDLSYVPDSDFEFTSMPPFLTVIDDHLYYQRFNSPIQRLRTDGSLDTEWSIPLTGVSGVVIVELRKTPWGAWLFQPFNAIYLNPGAGASQRLSYPTGNGGSAFALDDGTIVVANGVGRINRDGTRDPRFGRQATFFPVPFNDRAGGSMSGGPNTVAIIDRQGRMIIGGNFNQVGTFERMALVRILSDGTADPTWNPGAALGITLDESGRISALPYALALGPENSVVVGLRLVSTTGEPTFSFAVIAAEGNVSAEFDVQDLRMPTAPVVQPDGRILIGGILGPSESEPLRAVVRLEPDGTPDPTFDVELGFASGTIVIRSLALDERGRLYFGGFFDSVNGVARPGLARVFAYEPPARPLSLQVTAHQPRIATNEFLYLTAEVEGYPPPTLQWYRDGILLTGETNRGLRLAIADPDLVGEFKLVANNGEETGEMVFPAVDLAERSTRPGSLDPHFARSLPQINDVMQLLPVDDGSVFVGGGDKNNLNTERRPMVGRLTPDLNPDAGFGEDGFVSGNGIVETLVLLPEGGLMVTGEFSEIGGVLTSGFAILNESGQVLHLDYPILDQSHVSSALRLPDGKLVIAGRFTTVNGEPAYRLARLHPNLSFDPTLTSLLEPWQFIDDLQLDAQNRLLVSGERIFAVAPISNAPPTGLQRLLDDGTPDPTFQPVEGAARKVFVEPGGTLLVGLPPRRFDADGQLIAEFELEWGSHEVDHRAFDADHRMIRLADGSVVAPRFIPQQLFQFSFIRWFAAGLRDYHFKTHFDRDGHNPHVRAACLMPDGSLLVSTIYYGNILEPAPAPEEARRLVRVPVDADSRLKPTGVAAGEFRVQLETQPDRSYEIRRRVSLDSPASEVVTELDGDGYVRDISTPADQPMLFLELRRQ